MDEPADSTQAPDPRESTDEPRRSAGAAPRQRPYLHQAWINLKIWIPFLLNPFERRRVVRFFSRFHREGLYWNAEFPRQCVLCDEESDLRTRVFERTLRSFEYPLPIAAGVFSVLLVIGLLDLIFLSLFWALMLYLIAVLAGLIVVRLKSWPEQIRLTLFACPQHDEGVQCPDMVVEDNELLVFAPAPEIARAANELLEAQRKPGRRPDGPPPPSYRGEQDPTQPAEDAAPRFAPKTLPGAPKRPELPPIQLDEGEDESSD